MLCYGNYSGDLMNFGIAETKARADGLDVRTVTVTDDVATTDDRRGVAGGFYVLRALGTSADRGDTLDEVQAIGIRANERTKTIGVAFGGCTLPGSQKPLFEVPPGVIELGLGIHGEPGVGQAPEMTATELVDFMVERLMADGVPPDTTQCAVTINSLGGTGLEELLVLYSRVDLSLRSRGIEPRAPRVGHTITSLDMVGCSLTLCWLDDELSELVIESELHTTAFREVR